MSSAASCFQRYWRLNNLNNNFVVHQVKSYFEWERIKTNRILKRFLLNVWSNLSGLSDICHCGHVCDCSEKNLSAILQSLCISHSHFKFQFTVALNCSIIATAHIQYLELSLIHYLSLISSLIIRIIAEDQKISMNWYL